MQVELVVPRGTRKPNSRMFPVLVFLLVACYGILTLVLVEQGGVIQSQRNLIQQLSQDSQQLLSLKGQQGMQHTLDKKRAKDNASASSSARLPKDQSQKDQSPKDQSQKVLSRKSRIEKQPLQADDKIDRRRYPAQI